MPIYRLGERAPQIQEGVWIADNATVIGDVRLGKNVNVWFGAILRGDNDPITIGENTNVQDGSVLHTDDGVPLDIGANVTIGHKVMLHGCTIGEGSLIGINAVVAFECGIGRFPTCIRVAFALLQVLLAQAATGQRHGKHGNFPADWSGRLVKMCHARQVADLLCKPVNL